MVNTPQWLPQVGQVYDWEGTGENFLQKWKSSFWQGHQFAHFRAYYILLNISKKSIKIIKQSSSKSGKIWMYKNVTMLAAAEAQKWTHEVYTLICLSFTQKYFSNVKRKNSTSNTRVGSLSLLQGIFPTQGSNPGLLHCRQILYQLNYQGSPIQHASEGNMFTEQAAAMASCRSKRRS